MLAFCFPGQGSQRPGMGLPWVEHPSWELVEYASDVLGRDISYLLLEADTDELRQTRNAQMATFVLSLIVLDAVERVGLQPSLCAGHSLGEYTALAAAGAITFEEGVTLVHHRGEAMQAAADDQPGTMYAVLGLDDDLVDVACRRADGDCWVANYNASGQVVIAGDAEALTRAGEYAKQLGAKRVMPIPVGGAFHTPFMRPARERLREALKSVRFHAPEVPVFANVDALAHTDADEWPSILSAQLCAPVRWRQIAAQLVEHGASTLVECGPGGVLSGLAKRIVPNTAAISVSEPSDLDVLVAHVTARATALAEATAANGRPAAPQGEALFVTERMVVAPSAGIFIPANPTINGLSVVDVGADVQVGSVLGSIGADEVRSPFAGMLMGMLAVSGERVTPGQPIAWLRVS